MICSAYFSVLVLILCFWTLPQTGILRVTAADKTKRVKISQLRKQKQAVMSLTDPQQVPIQERRRQVQCHQPPYHQQCEVFSPRGWWKSGGMLMAIPPRSYCLNFSNLVLVRQLFETQCSREVLGFDQVQIHNTSACLRFEFLKCFLVDLPASSQCTSRPGSKSQSLSPISSKSKN